MEKFTQGEWVFKRGSKKACEYTAMVKCGDVMVHASVGSGVKDAELKANARLVAAAPEMYRALERVKQGHLNLVELNIVPERYKKEVMKIVSELELLIAKARGG